MKYALIGCGMIVPNHIKAAPETGPEQTLPACEPAASGKAVRLPLGSGATVDYTGRFDK